MSAGVVPLDYSCTELAEASQANEVRRIKRRVSGVLTDTLACVLHYDPEAQVPERVRLKWLSFKTRDYVPQPTRCHQCQGFGHIKAHCRKSSPTCPRCAGPHDFQSCPNLEAPKCANCGGSHSAAYRLCPKYGEVKATLATSVKEKISYKDALMRTRQPAAKPSAPPSEIAEPSTH